MTQFSSVIKGNNKIDDPINFPIDCLASLLIKPTNVKKKY